MKQTMHTALWHPPIASDFTPTYAFRQEALTQLRNYQERTSYTEIEQGDIQLTQALDVLKHLTNSPIHENHFGPITYYKIPYPRIHVNTDLFEPEARLVVRFQFWVRERSFPIFGSWEERLVYETFSFVNGNELTLNLSETPVTEYMEAEETGSFHINIQVQKLSAEFPAGQMFSHDTIVSFPY